MLGKIIIAVDFGTTYSAIGYAYWENGINLSLSITSWIEDGRAKAGENHQKFRRELPEYEQLQLQRSVKIFSGEKRVYKFESDKFLWGFEVQDDPDRVSIPKLFLDPGQLETAQRLARIFAVAGTLSPEDLTRGITKYLGSLLEHAMDHMLAKWGKEFVNQTPKEFVLSVPAIWSDQAKAKTMDCALNAGFGGKNKEINVRLISEPEAAAVYTITTLPDCSLQLNDTFLICDAGGGTVDLTTYRISVLQPSVGVEEVSIGDGGLCGSVTLDFRFREFIQNKLGSIELEDMNDMLEEFNEKIKPSFDGEDLEHMIPVPPEFPDDLSKGVQGGSLVITVDDLKGIYDPVVTRILILVQQQLGMIKNIVPGRATPILLVGGFGSSKYLRKRLEERFQQCTVLQPPDAWSAVVRGALLQAVVQKRKIRAHYGVKFREPWNPASHEHGELAAFAREHKVFDDVYEYRYFCEGRMEWYVKKGQEFSDAKSVIFHFYRNVGIYQSLKFKIVLWAYQDGEEGDSAPPFRDISCRQIGVLRPDLSGIPRSLFERKSSLKGDYYKIDYELAMRFDTVISFELLFKGETYGDVKIHYVDSVEEDNRIYGGD
ncbi:MAG: hypothetical protein M1813_004701 [Trichoglossum hirsutum]|nr:MAG: hypothetical protein M1813_004701 [Trichoglossum hirsutum]